MNLKILIFTHKFFPDIGGLETNAEILAKSFIKAGHQVRLVTWSQASAPSEFSFKVIRNPSFIQLLFVHKWADVVFENNPCLRMSWLNIFFNRPAVVALNTWVQRMNGQMAIQDHLKIFFLKRASTVIAVSNAVRKKSWPLAVVINNPYNDVLFRIIPDINKTIDFVFLGRLVSDKGANLAVEAMKYFPDRRLTIIGDGIELSTLKNLVAHLNLTTRVHFAGSLTGNDLAQCLNMHKYILIPSVWEEPFGTVVLEGMACGCLPIASNGGGLPDAVGKAGILFNRGDLNSLVNEINKITSNPAYELQLRQNAVDHLQAHRPQILAQQYLSILKNAVSLVN